MIEKFKKYVITRMILLKDISNYYNALKHELYDSLQFINQNRVAFDNAETLIIMDILTDGVKKGFFEITDLQGTTLVIISILKGLEIPFFGNEETFDYNTPLTLLLNILLNGLVKKL